jgi:hydrogenase nickel incorporation protein HypB
MVGHAAANLGLQEDSTLFIENVGNLVCPAGFDLGEHRRVALLSVTEGEDKPLKYPAAIAGSQLLLINKVDLLEHVDFDIDACERYAKETNPEIQIIRLSATTGEGFEEWISWLESETEAAACRTTGEAAPVPG